jgi:hypothetical protein
VLQAGKRFGEFGDHRPPHTSVSMSRTPV